MSETIPSHRRKIVFVDDHFYFGVLRDYLTREKTLIPEGIPATARIVRHYYNYNRAAWAIVFEDESFDPVSACCEIPELEIVWREVACSEIRKEIAE
jgi:hypothetical protein